MHATSAPRFRPPGSYLTRTTGRTRAAPNTQIDEAPAARRRSRGPRPNLSIISATRRSGAEGQLTAQTSCAAISARYKQHPAARRIWLDDRRLRRRRSRECGLQRERRRRAARLDVGSKRRLERRMADGRRRRRRVDEQRGAVCIERKWRRRWFERSAGLQLRIDVLRK